MKKLITLLIFVSASLATSTTTHVSAGIFAQRGKLYTNDNGILCCKYAIFRNNCEKDGQKWDGC
ncbi:hypothetical protein [Dyadobacter tibetensis]|uniref:hypothetical protein n=1 Tax=Dyadobacter tibetensis TaxID=1211851 RepID=UPI0004B727F9|nr:hypothetical protein [Dyadobacter tibetensis]